MSKTSKEVSILSIVQARPQQSAQAEQNELSAIQQVTGTPSISTTSGNISASRTVIRKSDSAVTEAPQQAQRTTSRKQISRTSQRAPKKGIRKSTAASRPAPFGADSAMRAKKKNIKAELASAGINGTSMLASTKKSPKKLSVRKIVIS